MLFLFHISCAIDVFYLFAEVFFTKKTMFSADSELTEEVITGIYLILLA